MKEAKSVKLNSQLHQHENCNFSPFKFAKLLDSEVSWDKHDQLGDILHWIRQVVALFSGLLWGAIPVTGGIWIFTFLAISTGIIYGYYAMILKIDEEEFGGHAALLQEGLFTSITLFLLGPVLNIFYHRFGCLLFLSRILGIQLFRRGTIQYSPKTTRICLVECIE